MKARITWEKVDFKRDTIGFFFYCLQKIITEKQGRQSLFKGAIKVDEC